MKIVVFVLASVVFVIVGMPVSPAGERMASASCAMMPVHPHVNAHAAVPSLACPVTKDNFSRRRDRQATNACAVTASRNVLLTLAAE